MLFYSLEPSPLRRLPALAVIWVGTAIRYHADFIGRFTEQESQNRVKKKPATLNAKQRAAVHEQLKEGQFFKPDYVDNTKIIITGNLRKWKMYNTSPSFFSLLSLPLLSSTTSTSLIYLDTVKPPS